MNNDQCHHHYSDHHAEPSCTFWNMSSQIQIYQLYLQRFFRTFKSAIMFYLGGYNPIGAGPFIRVKYEDPSLSVEDESTRFIKNLVRWQSLSWRMLAKCSWLLLEPVAGQSLCFHHWVWLNEVSYRIVQFDTRQVCIAPEEKIKQQLTLHWQSIKWIG